MEEVNTETTAPGRLPTKEEIIANVGTEFTFVNGEAQFKASLADFSSLIDTPKQVCFSIVFEAPSDAPATQGGYLVSHEKLGEFELFIVPIGRKESTLQLEAVFNNLLA